MANSKSGDTLLRALREQFDLESRTLDDLEAALQCEHQALTERQPGQLDHCIEQKQHAMEALGAAISRRMDWMRENGLEPTEASLENLLSRLAGAESDLTGQWQTITQRLTDCQQLNEINGRVLDVTRESVEQLLSVLQSAGEPERGNDVVELYTARGQSRSSRGEGGNSLTKA